MKRRETLSFEPGTLSVRTAGYGPQNYSGELIFDWSLVDHRPNEEDSGSHVAIDIPHSELIAIRDFLNRVIPLANADDAKSGGADAKPDRANRETAATKIADELQRLCCAETESQFFDYVTESITTICRLLRECDEASLLATIPDKHYWLLAKGRLRPDEPLYAIQLLKPGTEQVIAEAEGNSIQECVSGVLERVAR